LTGNIANNILKFLGMMIMAWLNILEYKQQWREQECILTLGDNTSASKPSERHKSEATRSNNMGGSQQGKE
jgi:hypothetical protein